MIDLWELEKLLVQMEYGKNGEYRPGGGTDDCRVWTGRVDENGYPDPRISIEVADCSLADTQKRRRERYDKKTRETQEHFARNVGRAVAALLNAAPELIRLAKVGQIVEEKSRDERRQDLRTAASRLKHGPGGRGGSGPCDPNCRKCVVEAELKKLDAQ